MFSFYRDRFLAPETSRLERLLAALAICRIGQADSELISAMTRQWSGSEAAAGDDNYNYKLRYLSRFSSLGAKTSCGRRSNTDFRDVESLVRSRPGPARQDGSRPEQICIPMEWPRAGVSSFSSLSPRLRSVARKVATHCTEVKTRSSGR